MQFTILGCFSPFSPYKGACSGYLLENGKIKIMIDCGNGSFANLQKFIDYKELDCLILTHFHSDHFNDFDMLRKAYQLLHQNGKRSNPLIIYAPAEGEFFDKVSSYPELFAVIPIEDSLEKDIRFGEMVLRFFEARHTVACYGIKAKKGQKKISYTSDTSFFEMMADEVLDSDYLFAEASLLEKDTEKTRHGHMTAKQAGKLAQMAKAKNLVLTHINPTYNPHILKREAETTFEGTVEIAKMMKTYK